MGSITAITLDSAMHASTNTVTNAWASGTSTSSFSSTNVSGIPKTSGLSVHPSTTTYGWTVTAMTKSDLQGLSRIGSMLTANNTL